MKNLTLLSLSLLTSLPVSARYEHAAKEVKASAYDVSTAASNLGSTASDLAGNTIHLTAEAARLAKDKAVAAGNYVEQHTEQTAHTVAAEIHNIATSVDNFATVTSVSAVSQVVQAGSATLQYIDKLLYPAAFTAAGYYTYKNGIKPYLPNSELSTKYFAINHSKAIVAREVGASLLTGGILFASLYGLLTRPKIAAFLNKNMPETASILAHLVGRERKLILEKLEDSSL